MKKLICIFLALLMLACAVSCTKADENGGATTAGGTTADVTTLPDGTTAEQTTTPDETTDDPAKKAIEEAIAHIGKKEYYAAYDLLNAHLDNEDAQELLRNFRFLPLVKSETEGGDERVEYTYNEDDMLVRYYIKQVEFDGEYRFIYNDKKQLVKREGNSTDSYYASAEYFYDAEGRLIKEVSAEYDGDYVHEYFYNADGEVEKSVWTYPDGTSTTDEYVYDDKGNVIKDTWSNSDGVCYIYETVYNENGDPIKYIDTDEEGKSVTECFYDEGGKPYKEVTTLPDGTTYTSAERFYDENADLIKELHYGSDGEEYAYQFFRDADGNVIKHTYEDSTGYTYTSEYTFDKYGNVVTEKMTDPEGFVVSRSFTYKLAYITYEISEEVEMYF